MALSVCAQACFSDDRESQGLWDQELRAAHREARWPGGTEGAGFRSASQPSCDLSEHVLICTVRANDSLPEGSGMKDSVGSLLWQFEGSNYIPPALACT